MSPTREVQVLRQRDRLDPQCPDEVEAEGRKIHVIWHLCADLAFINALWPEQQFHLSLWLEGSCRVGHAKTLLLLSKHLGA